MLFGADADIHMAKKKDEILIVCQGSARNGTQMQMSGQL